jgi:hypothetical protein
MLLDVRDNWGSYEWTFSNDYLNPNVVDKVFLSGHTENRMYDCRVVEIQTVTNDMGVVTRQKTKDLEIKTDVLGADVWISLYNYPNIRKKVKGILHDSGRLK